MFINEYLKVDRNRLIFINHMVVKFE